METEPNRDTLERAARGEAAALDEVFARNLGPLVAFIRMKAGGAVAARESAADLAQSVCREVLQGLDQFEFRGETAFRSWLFLHAMRKILDRNKYHHRDRRDVAREAGLIDTETVLNSYATIRTPSRQAEAREELQRIEAAMLELPEPQRDVVMMSRVMNLSYAEIAAEVGRTESAVRGLVARGLATLAAHLDRD